MTDERTNDLPGADTERRRAPRHRPAVRALDDGTTERVRLIEFVWGAKPRKQPVLLVDREWLH